ncbi:SGNH hydrolase [Stemphylium lycopersici]|uniref:SGNH hydrolase n=1 Tax=Stemphylium lycopersici TaxID=183478 RepID=A0A364MRL6_STELY|nr:SGNH hydrolase [Stemphylium lycopersici]
MIIKLILGLSVLISSTSGYVPHHAHHGRHGRSARLYQRSEAASSVNSSSVPTPPTLLKRDNDPSSMEWIKRWAAIGDSYTAGIGAGRPLGHRITADEVAIRVPSGLDEVRDNWKCSRYDMAYPKVIEAQFGAHIEKDGGFQYLACSGDRSEQIYQQAQALKGDLDFVTFTSGGNDLCLAKMIADCIMLPYGKTSACETVIAKAQENAKTIITDNIFQILEALDEKMNEDGIVVVNSYAQFFDTQEDNCDRQSWDFFWFLPLGSSYRALTIERRHVFNQLVLDINQAIRDAVDKAAKSDKIKYKVGYADWDYWVSNEVDDRMCSPSSNGDYPDPKQPNMHFIKPDTHPWDGWQDDFERTELRKRDMNLEEILNPTRLSNSEKRQLNRIKTMMEARDRNLERTIYDSILYKSPDPRAAVKHKLDARAPSPPGCPGDGGFDMTFGMGMPDQIGRNFHPNEAGHLTIASFALSELMDLRAIVLGVDSPACAAVKDEFTCFSKTGSKFYVSGNRTNENYEGFCKEVQDKHDKNKVNWSYSKTYDEGTPEQHDYVVTLSNGVSGFDKDECVDSMKKIMNSCDTSDNPMNWKGGGRYIRGGGDYKYELNPRRSNRPWPPPKAPYGRCEGWYKGWNGRYKVEGAGFSTWDYGKYTLRPNMDSCYGLGTSFWKFEYFDNPADHDGHEWYATFSTPIWVRARCWANNKIVKAAGGWTNGCKGND